MSAARRKIGRPGKPVRRPGMLARMGQPDSTRVTILRCDPALNKPVLALAAQAWHAAERAAYWRTINGLIDAQQADRVILLGVHDQERWVAAQVAQVMHGRVAMVW